VNEELREVVRAAMEEALSAHTTHADHHEWIARMIEHDKIKRERLEKIKTQVFGWGILTILSAVGYAVWEGTKVLLKLKN
jgi:hypothetical protein